MILPYFAGAFELAKAIRCVSGCGAALTRVSFATRAAIRRANALPPQKGCRAPVTLRPDRFVGAGDPARGDAVGASVASGMPTSSPGRSGDALSKPAGAQP